MDPALLKERELFKKRALSTPSVEKRKTDTKSESTKDDRKKFKSSSSSNNTAPKLDINSYKTSTGSSQYRFGVLAKIVKHMRTRHQEGETYPLTLEEILDETNQLDVGNKVKQWLQTEALINNPKIEVTPEGKFVFKALYKLKDRKSLLKLLRNHDLKGLGGVLLDDVQESLPHCEKALRILKNQNEIVFITRPIDKKKVLFYNDRTASLPIDEEFQKLWRSVAVDAMDDAKIEEYLDKQGMCLTISFWKESGQCKTMDPRNPSFLKEINWPDVKKVFKKPRDNEHLADLLETYENDTLTQKNTLLVVVFALFNLRTCEERARRVKRIVGGIPADAPVADDPVVYTRFAGRAAKVRGVREFPNYVFRGIKYAYPPVGKDRFLRPREKFLEGEVNATRFSQPCVQPRPGSNKVIGSEECLALNVFTPELPTGLEGLPVVIWIHGGGFRYGSASQYGVRHLVSKRLVVVTIQYRLGSLGFLSSGDKHLPGNVALWDMVLAVQWVRNYIGFFGGNPYKIVVMGHGTGASSALLVVLSKLAKGQISGVVAMSGTAISNWAVDHSPQNTASNIAQQNGCPTTSTVTMVKCLQKLPPDDIIKSRGFMSGLSGGLGAAPVSEGFNDGRSLPGLVEDEPINDLNKEKNPKIPLLTGITRDETKRAVKGHFRKDVEYKLKTIPNFVDNVLVKQLTGTLFKNKLLNVDLNQPSGSVLPLNFGNYLQYNSQSLHDALDKVAEVTGDVLFNLPAFLTVNQWCKNGAPTYLYSFEHSGKRQKGGVFLKGSPIVGNDTAKENNDNNTIIGHGDDLAYLFDAYDVEGNSLESESKLNEDDKKVRDIFTQMVSDFAHYGKVRIEGRDVDSFSAEKNNFIRIKAKPSLSSNFRVCQMALWSNFVQKLKSSSCSFLDALSVKVLPDLPLPPLLTNNSITNIVPQSNLLTGNQGIPLSVPGVANPLNVMSTDRTNRNKQNSILGGFIG
ncbi:hypothetical protein NQ315_009689 [Exocentrus adspersus]|uniref:TFIIE beta domain-containing protein n=1 Tax=Exocentrus adspersus TaxID=1586481 RepID=A0AAV8WHX2_9CUCU|nr:hypothetical protein NQ315_009689 [Exocentrus adspersus]